MILAWLLLIAPLDDDLSWHQTCHIIDGQQKCENHLWGKVEQN